MKASKTSLPALVASLLLTVGSTGSTVAAQTGVGAGVGVTTGGAVNAGTPGVTGSAGFGAAVGTEVQGSAAGPGKGAIHSEQRMSVEGKANQNAQGRPGATRGLERAKERMNPRGIDHARSLEIEGAAAGAARSGAATK